MKLIDIDSKATLEEFLTLKNTELLQPYYSGMSPPL
jgi:hypothetical protein